MNEINIFVSIHAKRGAFISEGRYEYTKAANGAPAMRATWKIPKMLGAYFSTEERVFVFAEHAIKISPADDKSSQGAAKWGRSSGASRVPGIIGLVGFGADLIRGATTDTSGAKGFVFTYSSDDGGGGLCWCIAPEPIVAEIFASVPSDRIGPSIAPK